jgi:predicted  nucleic acid-binding Zn-ribbon protein
VSRFDDLIALQDLDIEISQVRHELDRLPERQRLAELDAQLADLDARRAEVEAERAVVAREQRRLEDEVALVTEKADKVEHQLYEGGITSPKEAEALQADLESLRRHQRTLEDRVLEQMELAEPLDETLAGLVAERGRIEGERSVAQAAFDTAAGALGERLGELEERRAEAVAAVPEDLAGQYEKLRARLGGIGAARLVGSRCDGCHLTLPSAEAEALRAAPPDEVIHCPECGRILVR